MATSKAQRQRATAEMMEIINRKAEEARTVRVSEEKRMAAIKSKEEQDRRDEEITKMALCFSFGLLIGIACISTALWLMGIHPVQAVIP